MAAGSIWAKALTVPAKGLRAFASAAMASPTNRPLGAYSGVTPGTTDAILSVSSSQWTVQPFGGFLDVSAAGDGATPFGVLDVQSGGVTAADSSNPRADLLWVRHDDPDETNDNTKPAAAVVGYTAGTPGAAPQLPATPARAIPLARIDVPKLNNGAPTISLIAPFTVAAGGILPVRGTSEYPANPYKGMSIRDLSFNGLLTWDGSAWSGDTDWTPQTATGAGVTPSATVPPGVARNGRTVLVRGVISAAFLANNNETGAVVTFQAGFRPKTPVVRRLGSPTSVNSFIQGTFYPDGTVKIRNGSTATAPNDIDLSGLSGFLAEQ